MKVRIDLGCHDGSTIDHFLKRNPDYIVFGFEPSTRYEKQWKDLQKKYPNKITFSHKAAYIKDGKVTLNLQPKDKDLGSSIMSEKRDYNDGEKVEVECFDLSQWIKQFSGDYVSLKMNIEGAEFPILRKMIKDGTDRYIDYAQIEWHDGRKMPDYEANKQYLWDNLGFEWEHWRGI